MIDLVLRNARIADGTGNPCFWADIAIEGDRITRVEDLEGVSAKLEIDVDGLTVAPGFIDLHTHCDFTLPLYPRAESMVRQGVTTIIGGNCGFSPFPVVAERADLMRAYSEFLDAGISWDWSSAGEYAAMLESLPLACNVGLQVGHGAVRIAVMGFDRRAPSEAELDQMCQLVAESMDDGALGMSSGLIYVPGEYSDTAELVALAQVVADAGGFYSSHIRGEGATLLDAVSEAITVGREAFIPVQLSHHKATGAEHWGKTAQSLQLIDEARAQGIDVLADQYPYTAGSTTLSALLPGWALEGGVTAMRQRLEDATTRARIREEILSAERFGADTVLIASVPVGPFHIYEGKTLGEIGQARQQHPVDAAMDLLAAEGASVGMITFSMSEDDVERVMCHPAVAIASDGWVLSPAAGGKPHPRSYGTFVRVLGHYVRDAELLGLENAVRKMTSLPAQRLNRLDLGLIRPGFVADLVAFDAETVGERGTYQDPHQFCDGVHYVIVNGKLVISNQEDTGVVAGKVLGRNGR